MQENVWGLARYARIVQDAGLVPIVEPEILMDGDHNIERTAEVQERLLTATYKALKDNGVFLEGTLLKPSMTVPGADCKEPVSFQRIFTQFLSFLISFYGIFLDYKGKDC
jgi:fructose-bisphosphate aldolase class I